VHKPEFGDDDARAVEEDALGTEIAVYHPGLMRRGEGVTDLGDQPGGCIRR
jgi:hypothetical protein